MMLTTSAARPLKKKLCKQKNYSYIKLLINLFFYLTFFNIYVFFFFSAKKEMKVLKTIKKKLDQSKIQNSRFKIQKKFIYLKSKKNFFFFFN
jgi:membrane protein CcdC involved in cytochrome C biogenesis